VFTPDESLALMACGYQMASKAFYRDLRHLHELFDDSVAGTWPFADMLKDITSTGRRDQLLAILQKGHSLVI
jgi:hypothetical protein